jgi:putative transposase
VIFAFIEAEKAHFPVEVLCAVLGVSRSGYYAHKTRPESIRAKQDTKLAATISAHHRRSRQSNGSPRIYRDLKAEGVRISRKRVERILRHEGIPARGKQRFRRTTDSNHPNPIAPHVLERNFHKELPNQAWVTDVTYVWTLEGWLYLAAILDLCCRRVVGWAVSATHDRHLALQALERATDHRRTAPGLLHHSDRGSTYGSQDDRTALPQHGFEASMSRKGNCWDNAVAESFFATIKGELIDHETYATRAEAEASIGDSIDHFYNPQRRHSSINYMSPIEFELKLQTKQESA